MDPTFDNLPYQIPGPAGGTLSQVPSQLPLPLKSSTTRLFQTSPWQAALQHLQAPPHGSTLLSSSIALLRSHALSDRFQRLSSLPVLLDALSWVGRDASILLRDPTGSIRATVHAEVFSKHKAGIEIGAALLLSGVAAIAYLERRPVGFRRDEGESLHVSIQACHVMKLFPVGCACAGAISHDPKQSYEQRVRKPTVVRRPSTPRQSPPMPSLPQRPPLQQRVEPQPPRRSFSRGANMPYRGGFQPRGQQRRPVPFTSERSNAGEKRPYAPANSIYAAADGRGMGHARRPGIQPAIRRPGMQPLPKRPAPARNLITASAKQISQTGEDTAIGALTDEQLDSLLGDVDVDAVIAASGKGTAQVKAVGIGGNERERQKATEKEQDSDGNDSGLGERRQSGNELRNIGASGEHGKSSSILEHVMRPGETKTSEDRATHLTSACVELPQAQLNGKRERALSKADEAMIDSLLDGLDGSDF